MTSMPARASNNHGVIRNPSIDVIRRQPKRGETTSLNFFDKCISRDAITTNRVTKFSQMARGYMAAYKALEPDEMKENDKPVEISHCMIEKMKNL